ncbi:hypothetical protein B0H19DRAFT_1157486 [Mycena capillaripes]|nr:hypothetical protein B0H19DRAFT_1157486 [Mycena capillaripes]
MSLPQELIDEILEHLAEDYKSLKACSLVSRAWVLRSRSNLFETCTLLPRNIHVFQELLRSPGCTFLRHIRSIKASRYDWHHHDHCFNEIVADLRVAQIHTLKLTLNIVVNAANADTFFRTGFATAFPHVRRLLLICSFDGQPAPLVDMICFFPALQELQIRPGNSDSGSQARMSRMAQPLAEPPASALPPQELHSLWLSAPSLANPILAWLHAFKHLSKVKSLTLPPMTRPPAPIVRAALHQMGESLCHLDITVTVNINPTALDLSRHPNLKTLAIRENSNCCRLLLRLTAPTLENLLLDFLQPLQRRKTRWDVRFKELDEFLSPARFPRLSRVVARTLNREDGDYLRESLPLLESLGVLQAEWSPENVPAPQFWRAQAANANAGGGYGS